MLVTSRQALHLRWEHEYPLLPLQVPSSEHTSADAIAARFESDSAVGLGGLVILALARLRVRAAT